MLAVHEDKREIIQRSIRKYEEEYRELERLQEAAPVIHSRFATRHGLCAGSINFVLDNVYYLFSFADNPFFPDIYQKIKVTDDGEYYGRYYVEELAEEGNKDYFLDELWTPCASVECIETVAHYIFDRLMSKPCGAPVVEKERRRVPNTYNDDWHYETIIKSNNEKHKIDF